MTIVVRLKPGETTAKLIARFQKATAPDLEKMKTQKGFVSKTEKRLLAEKEKERKIRKMERLQKEGLI